MPDPDTTARIVPLQVPIDQHTTKTPAQVMESNDDIYSDADFISRKLWTAEDEEEYQRNIRSMEESLEIFVPNAAASKESSAQFSAVSKESSANVIITDEAHPQANELGLLNTVELNEPFKFPNIPSSSAQNMAKLYGQFGCEIKHRSQTSRFIKANSFH